MVQPFLIANTRVGIEKDLEPWLIPNDAYPDLEDCYLFRGRVKKRKGYRLLGRLNRVLPQQTDGGGGLTITIPGFSSGSPMPPGDSSFVVGTTHYQDGTSTAGGDPVTLLVNGIGTATLDRGSGGNPGQLIITGGPAATSVFYYSGLPVMGLRTQETVTINQTALIAFDTVFSYKYNANTSTFVDASLYKGTTNVVTWSGPNYQSFWTTNYADAMWATNYQPGFQSSTTSTTSNKGDGLRWFDEDQSGWVNFLPPIDSSNFLMGALIILPYKGFLVVLNTWEGTAFGSQQQYQQRARWCKQLSTPYYTTPVPTNYQGGTLSTSWRSDLPGNGGFIDAATNETIIAAEFVKDSIVVYFERSTWQLRYTGNPLQAFIWEKINTELGSESTFSVVPFDKFSIAIGNVGIHLCDTVNVERIDLKIPDDIFEIEQLNNGPQRVCGVRDFLNELVYWAMPIKTYNSESDVDNGETITFPNKMLVYNYRDGDESFSYFNDSFTALGYIEAIEPGISADLLWQNASMTWQSANFNWISPIQDAAVVRAVGGNQQGFVELLQEQVANDDSLFISNISAVAGGASIFCPNHNLETGDFVYVTAASGVTGLTGNIYKIIVPLVGSPLAPDPNNFILELATFTGIYTGTGTMQVVNNISILTKRFNPFVGEAAQARIHYADLYFDTTPAGSVTVYLFINEDSTVQINAPNATNTNLSSNVVNTFPESTYAASPDTNLPNQKLWKRIYFEDISQLYQFQLTLSDAQMMSNTIRQSDIVLHGLLMYFSKAGRLIDV